MKKVCEEEEEERRIDQDCVVVDDGADVEEGAVKEWW